MKSKLFYLLSVMLLAYAGNVKADELVVQNFELEPGQQTTVAVELNNTDNQYIMLDFFLQLPSGVTIASDEDDELMYELNSTRARRSHTLEIREQSNGSYRVLLYSSSNEALKGTSGAVFTMTLEADASVTPGDYTGTLTNQLAMDSNKNRINFPDKTFNVTISGNTSTPTSDYLSISDFEIGKGQQMEVAVEMNNTDNQYIMLDFFLQLPSGVTIASDEDDELMYELNSTRARRSHTLEIREQNNGSYRVLLYSSSNEALKGTSGAVFTMTLEADASATPDNYTGMLTNQLAMDSNKNRINFPDRTFNVRINNVTQPQSLTLELSPMTYGDEPLTLPSSTDQGLALTWTSGNTSVATVSGNTLTVKGAGTATITATQAGNGTYNSFSKTYTLTVNKAQLTITAEDKTKTAGEANPELTVSYDGFVNGEDASVLTTQPTVITTATESSAAGTYPITASGATAANYNISYVAGTLTVVKADQSISLSSIPAMVYGAAPYSLPAKTAQNLTLTWTSSNTSVATVSGNTLTVKGAGSATITATQAGNGTYNSFSKTYTLTVDKSVLTVTAESCSRMEGALNPDFTISYSGFKYDDNASSLTMQPTASTQADASSPAGEYPITVSGGASDNYEFNYVNGTLTVTAKSNQTMQLAAIGVKTYGDGADTLPSSTDQGLSLTWTSSNTSVATVSGNTLTFKGAGTASITATNGGDATHNPFSRTFALTVNKAVLTVTADDCSRMEGAENPDFTISYSGFKYDDNASSLTTQPTASTQANATSPAGEYPITVSGGVSDNYEFNYVNGTLTVTAKNSQTIQLTEIAAKTYGDGAETLPSSTDQGLALTWTSSNTSVATVSGNTLTFKGAGTATITATNSGDATHNPFSRTFALTVNKAVLTVTAENCSRMEGAPNPDFTVSYSGFKYDDNASSLTTQPTASTQADATSPAGEYPITVSGGASDNYEFNYVNGTLTVTANIPIKATGISLNQTSLSLTTAGATSTLTATVAPSDVTDGSVTWSSSDTSVATISTTGVVTAVSNGTALITATTNDGTNLSASCNVTVIIVADPSSIIEFADSTVKALCVANWDTNGDGELSHEEAAAVTDLGNAFQNNTSITSFEELQYFTGLITICNSAFYGCSQLTSIKIPSSVTSIGRFAFWSCRCLTSVSIPEGVVSIEDIAFYYCDGLVSVTIPKTVTEIGRESFRYSSRNLISITVDDENPIYNDGGGNNCLIETSSNKLLIGCNNTIIPEGVTSIGDYAFEYCSGLSSIVIPESVTSIGYMAFKNCKGLTAVTLPDGVSIGNYAFNGTGLTSISIPSGVTYIGAGTFRSCRSLTNVTIPSSVTSIFRDAFDGCSNLGVMISYIEEPFVVYGFNELSSNCVLYVPTGTRDAYIAAGWTEEKFKGGVVEMGSSLVLATGVSLNHNTLTFNVVGETKNLVATVSPSNVTNGNVAWSSSDTSVAKVSSTGVVTPIKNGNAVITATTKDGTNLNDSCYVTVEMDFNNIIFADTKVKALCVANWDTNRDGELSEYEAAAVTDLGNVFQNNTSIKNFNELESFTGLTCIGDSAFQGCSSLTSIIVPSSVTEIGTYAFYGCSALRSVNIPDGITNIETYTFYGCSSLSSITIPHSVTEIGTYAFYGCSALRSVNIPDGITNIETYTFYGCSSLSSITIPHSVTRIGSYSFCGCSSLSSITIPHGVTRIDTNAFRNCKKLTSITIPSTVTFIGTDAFNYCNKLTSVTVGNPNPVTIQANTFSNRANAVLTVPVGSKSAYKSSRYWNEFKEIHDPDDLLNSVTVNNLRVEHGANATFPVYMTNTEPITAAQFEIALPDGVRLLDCELTDRKEDHVIQYSQLENGNYQVMILSLSSSNFKGSDGSLVNLRLGTDAVKTYQGISVTNIELTTSETIVREPYSSSADLTICDIPLGDTNGDGHITITDAVAIVNYKLGRPSKSFVSGAADVNGDGSISITDAVIIVNWILHEDTGSSVKSRDTLKFADTIDPQ